MKLNVVKLRKTCMISPSQWEGKLDDGRMIYIRYRFGTLYIYVSKNKTNNISDCFKNSPIYEERIGGAYDGLLEFDDLKKHTKDIIKYSIKVDKWT